MGREGARLSGVSDPVVCREDSPGTSKVAQEAQTSDWLVLREFEELQGERSHRR